MAGAKNILSAPPQVVNIGLEQFAVGLGGFAPGVVHVDWRPPAHGDPELIDALDHLAPWADQISAANREAVHRMIESQPVWIGVGSAGDVIPGMTPTTVLHSGPPVTWEQMSGCQRGGVIAALIFEGFARDADEAVAVAASGKITFSPCHHHGAVGPMSGVISASMPVLVAENRVNGRKAYSIFNGEGRQSSHTMGLFGPPAQEMLRWLRDTLAPALSRAVSPENPIDLKGITARALQMGDECHNRHVASTSLLTRQLLPRLARAEVSPAHLAEIGEFLIRSS